MRRTRFALSGARIGESVLIGVAAAMVTLAAIAARGGGVGRIDAWCVALVPGVLCAISWRHEHRKTPLDVARALDRKLRHQGGLLTAYELENRRESSPMARLLVARVLVRLRLREALHAMFPPLALPVAAPILGVSLLALALDLQRRPEQAVELVGLADGMTEVLDAVEANLLDEGRERRVDSETTRELLSLARKARDVRRRAEFGREDPAQAARALAEIDTELSEVTPRVAADPELRALLDDARNWVDAARMELDRDAPANAASPGVDSGAAGAAAPDTAFTDAEPGGNASAGESEVTSVTERLEDGTMITPPGSGEASLPMAETPEDSGTVVGRTWPAEYDGVVAGWIESRRRAPDRSGRNGRSDPDQD